MWRLASCPNAKKGRPDPAWHPTSRSQEIRPLEDDTPTIRTIHTLKRTSRQRSHPCKLTRGPARGRGPGYYERRRHAGVCTVVAKPLPGLLRKTCQTAPLTLSKGIPSTPFLPLPDELEIIAISSTGQARLCLDERPDSIGEAVLNCLAPFVQDDDTSACAI